MENSATAISASLDTEEGISAWEQETAAAVRAARNETRLGGVRDSLQRIGESWAKDPASGGGLPVVTPPAGVNLPADIAIGLYSAARNTAEWSLDVAASLGDAHLAQYGPLIERFQGEQSKAAQLLETQRKAKDEQSTPAAEAERDAQARAGVDLPPNLADPTSIDLKDIGVDIFEKTDRIVDEWNKAQSNEFDGFVQKIVQFAAPWAAATKALGGFQAVDGLGTFLANTGKAGVADFMTSYAVFDPHEARLADVMREFDPSGRLINDYIDFAMSDPADTDAEGRWKNAVENTLLGVPFAFADGLFHYGKSLAGAVREHGFGWAVPDMGGGYGSPIGQRGSIGADEPGKSTAGQDAVPGGPLPDAGGRGDHRPGTEGVPLADSGIADSGAEALRLTERSSDSGTATTFQAALQATYDADAFGKQVTVLQPEQLKDHRMFLADGGEAGFAISPAGEVVGLFKSPSSTRKGVARSALRIAVQQGGTHLNAFAGVLPRLYGPEGFVEVARLKFSREFAPPGWDYQAMGEPDIVFMRHDPAAVGKPYQPGTHYVDSYDEGLALARGAK